MFGHAIAYECQNPGNMRWRKEETQVSITESALNLLLRSDITVVTALSLSAVDGLRWESGVAFTADHFLALVLSGKGSKRGLNLEGTHTTTSQTEDKMESRFLLDVVIRESSAIFELLTSEDESLLIRRDTLFILNLGSEGLFFSYLLDIFNSVSGFDIKSDSLARQRFDEDLHFMLK